jgi:hypothetical protein
VFRHLPTSQDAAIGIFADGRTTFAFQLGSSPRSMGIEHTYSLKTSDFGLIGNIYFGNAQANGSSPRLVERLGGDLRVIYDKVK